MPDFASAVLNSIAAIVVTYEPHAEVLTNLTALRQQVSTIIVVDNGSAEPRRAMFRSAASAIGFLFLENETNLGIATALNRGMERAFALNLELLLFFDQDSRVTKDFVSAMLYRERASHWGDRLGILVPQYEDLRDGRQLHPKRLSGGGLEEAITSGSLMRATTLKRLGPFADELFIDGVDHEMSLRVRKAGMVIEECASAVLLHSPGTPTSHTLFGKQYQTSNYSPLRRYYQERSKPWIMRRYLSTFPAYCLRLGISTLREAAKILLVEKNRTTKFRYFFSGLWDGIRDRMGPYRER